MKIDLEKSRLVKWPAPVLKSRAEPIDVIDDDIRTLAERMLDIMIESNGIGLAAPQANQPLRMFVISLEADKENAIVFINPEIKPYGPVTPMEEGCLSVPGMHPKITRPSRVKITALNLEGEQFTIDAGDLLAKCIQHEYDHLEGKTIADRMSRMSRMRFRPMLEELKKHYKDRPL
ncbi:MAG: peptide deformylase [Phycisphaerae bacterium]|jgi:peptide deformylase